MADPQGPASDVQHYPLPNAGCRLNEKNSSTQHSSISGKKKKRKKEKKNHSALTCWKRAGNVCEIPHSNVWFLKVVCIHHIGKCVMKHKKKNKVNKGWDIDEAARRITCANWWQGIINLQSTK